MSADTPAHGAGFVPAGRYSTEIDRLVIRALSRLQARAPLRTGFGEAEIADELLQASASSRPPSHRGGQVPDLDELGPSLRALTDAGTVESSADGYRMAGTVATLGAEMDTRVAEMIALLRAGGVEPMPISAAARQTGVPPAVIDQVRAAGLIVTIGPRIEYPAATLAELRSALVRARRDDGTVDRAALRAATGLSHRRADALVEWADTTGP